MSGTSNLANPGVDEATDSLMMRATILNPGRILVDGQFVAAIIRERTAQPRLVVPQAALQVEQSGYYSLVVDSHDGGRAVSGADRLEHPRHIVVVAGP